jgi:hypothetical protein
MEGRFNSKEEDLTTNKMDTTSCYILDSTAPPTSPIYSPYPVKYALLGIALDCKDADHSHHIYSSRRIFHSQAYTMVFFIIPSDQLSPCNSELVAQASHLGA